MREEYMTADEIQQEIADLKIRLAFQMEFEGEVEAVLQETSQPEADLIKAIRTEESKILQDIGHFHAKKKRRAPMSVHSLPKVCKAAVVLAAVLMISITSAFATMQMIRVGILKLDIQAYDDRTEFQLMQTGKAMEVPEGWAGVFYPVYIPEGFMFSHLDAGEAVYFDASGNYMEFREATYGIGIAIDTEDAQVSTIYLHDTTATVVEKNGRASVIWAEHNRLFTLHLFGDRETAIEIANSVTLIQ